MPSEETAAHANDNDLRLVTERHGAAAVVRVSGELDAYRAPDLEDLGASLLADGVHTLVLNMSGTTFLDSSGLRAMVTLRDRMLHAEGEFALVDPTDAVRRLLTITGLEDQFVIESSDEAHEQHDAHRSTS
jgi:anti-sigma B factor antagonist